MNTAFLKDKLNALHQFWFNGHIDWPGEESLKRWFMGGDEFDKELISNYSELPSLVHDIDINSFINEDPVTISASIIALDQLPRNLYRKSANAFMYDGVAMLLAEIISEHPNKLSYLAPSERLFVLMPYQHTEKLEQQERSIELFRTLAESAPAEHQELANGMYEYAKKHHEIIAKFGRFPHRNEVLGRKSTKAELKYLEGAERFGQ